VVLGRVATYSTGPALVRSKSRTTVTARTSGNIATVARVPGDKVAVGDVIARLDDTDQRAKVETLGHEFENQLRDHLLRTSEGGTDAALRQLRVELEAARTDLDLRTIRAQTDGVIGDVHVHAGQHVDPGDIVASVGGGTGSLEVVAFLPGEDRPQLAPGMPIRFELAGYRYVYRTLTIDTVSTGVMSPVEARRVVGPELAGDLQLTGPVVLVTAPLPTGDFEADGRTLQYHDGMPASADVRVRSERIVFALIPGLRRF
jgi:membrane fusion protein (multidrug efflux system)